MKQKVLDLICIGRAGVDLYGDQVGGRLEDMGSFSKYVGGSPSNTAIGTARLGLKSAMLTRVGDEHMGRFIRETMEAEGVDTQQVITDPQRLTALCYWVSRMRNAFHLFFTAKIALIWRCAKRMWMQKNLIPKRMKRHRKQMI